MGVETVAMSQVLKDQVRAGGIPTQAVKDRAKQFFRHEFLSHLTTELDMFALWPPESQDPPYFRNTSPPRNYAYEGELLWLVPLDGDGDLHRLKRTVIPYPIFHRSETAVDDQPNKQIRYIGTLTTDGRLILLGWYYIKEGRYSIPYTNTLSIDFKTPDKDYRDINSPAGQKPLKSGHWAYFPLPAEGLRVQTGPINYSFKAIEAILRSDPHS